MAEKKRIYKIQINGLEQSVDLVKSLNAQLDTLTEKIKGIGKQKIVISGEVEEPKGKKVVNGNADVGAEKELAIQKQLTAEIKATAQAQAALTEEYQKSLLETEKQKEVTKEVRTATKDMLKGAIDETGNYTNTLNGLKAQLRDMKAELGKVELGTEEYDKLNEKTKELNDNVLALEKSYGVFNRNVGNYPTAEIEAFRQQFALLYGQMSDLITESNDLQRQLAEATPGTEAYDRIAEKLKQVKDELSNAKDAVNDFNNGLKQLPQGGITINVGGVERQFANAKQAVKELTKEMQQLAVEGKTDTQEFKDLMVTLARVKTTINQTTQEMQSYIGNAKGLADTVEIMKGLTGIASIGQGLMTLFGGTNTELDETLKKFAGLTLVMQGIEQQYKAIQDGQSIWGVSLKNTWNWLDKIGNWKIPFSKKTFNEFAEGTKEWNKALQAVAQWRGGTVEDQFVNIRNSMDELTNGFEQFSTTEVKKFTKAMASLQTIKIMLSTNDATEQLDLLNQKIEQTREQLRDLEDAKVQLQMDGDVEGLKEVNKQIEQCKASLDTLQQSEVTLRTEGADKAISDLNENVRDFDGVLSDLEGKGIEVKGLKELYAQFKNLTSEGGKLTSTIKTLPKFLQSGGLAARVLAAGINMATTAVKTFGKATIILAAVQLAFNLIAKAVEGISNGISYLSNGIKSMFGSVGAAAHQTEKALDSVSTSIERANDRLSQFNRNIDLLSRLGGLSSIDALNQKIERLGLELGVAGNELKTFIRTVDNLDKPLKDNLNAIGTWYEGGEKSVDAFINRWNILRKAVEAGTDEIKQGGKGWEWWYTASDAVDDFTDANKAMLQDLSNSIGRIDFTKPEKAVRDFEKLFEGQLGEARDYAWKNIDKMFPEQPWAQMLKARLDQMKGFVDQYKEMMGEISVESANLLKQAEKTIRDNTAAALPSGQREQAQSRNAREDEINAAKALGYDANTLQKVIDSINAKFDRQDRERKASAAKSGSDMEAIQKSIRDNLLAAQKEGLDKQLKQLRNAQEDELKAAQKSGRKVKEQILAINAKYNALILKAEKQWYDNYKKTTEQFYRDLLSIQKQYEEERQRTQMEAERNHLQRTIDLNDAIYREQYDSIRSQTEMTGRESQAQNRQLLEEQKKLHEEQLAETETYIRDKYALLQEESRKNQDILLSEEEGAYRQQSAALEKSSEDKLQELNHMYEQGIIMEDEYQRMLEESQIAHTTAQADLFQSHQDKMSEIERNGEAERTLIQRQGAEEMQAAQAEANQRNIQAIQQMYDNIGRIADKEQRKNLNRHTGLFNISKEKERLNQVLKAYEDMMAEVDEEYETLKTQLNDGEITFDEFQNAKEELDDLREAAEEGAEDTMEELEDLGQKFGQSMASFVSQIASTMNQMLGVINDIVSMKYDMQEEALQQEQDQLDRETEMIEKAMSKQAEIVQSWKEKINDTEDNLKNARGERREALISSLEQQKAAYEKETEALKKQELEKEKIAQKEQNLKKKQEALEKKRKQAEQKSQMITAIINTAVAATQAYAAYPPPASYILAAAVTALGLAQVATIASQKYADGGVIEGKSHAQGGVKVLGGMAEVEGGEYVVNKKTTSYNADILSYINGIKRRVTEDDIERFFDNRGKFKVPASHGMKFANGGMMPELADFNLKEQINWQQPQQDDRPVIVSVVDIVNESDNYRTVKAMAGLAD